MARRKNSQNRDGKSNGSSVSVAKTDGAHGLPRAGQRELSSIGSTNGRSEGQVEDHDYLHQRIAELAYMLYERSGFQQGKDLEHWLEAEQQIKSVRDQAA